MIFLSNRVHPDGKGNVNDLIGRIGNVAVGAIVPQASNDSLDPSPRQSSALLSPSLRVGESRGEGDEGALGQANPELPHPHPPASSPVQGKGEKKWKELRVSRLFAT